MEIEKLLDEMIEVEDNVEFEDIRARILKMFKELEESRDWYRETAGYAINDRVQRECLHNEEWWLINDVPGPAMLICSQCGLVHDPDEPFTTTSSSNIANERAAIFKERHRSGGRR